MGRPCLRPTKNCSPLTQLSLSLSLSTIEGDVVFEDLLKAPLATKPPPRFGALMTSVPLLSSPQGSTWMMSKQCHGCQINPLLPD